MSEDYEVFIKYLKSLGLEVHTRTKARGYQGFFMKNRIDISKNIQQSRVMPTLMHEFAHYVHHNLEPSIARDGGSLKVLFDEDDVEIYEQELLKVTHFVDSHSKCEKLLKYKEAVKSGILEQESIIKTAYPDFMRSKKFKEFDKYIKKSKAKYLLKCDRVCFKGGLRGNACDEIISVDSLEKDFPDMPTEFAAYIRLHSLQKKQARVSSRINKLKKYYAKPTELFARLVEGLYLDKFEVQKIAPNTSYRFFRLLHGNYYGDELRQVFAEYL
ncbi:MAG: hypothetical protein NC191_08240 [Muribaculaceae bacterium]|nr:hypothetical protein [Muribaculaceae bacterium]